MFILTGHAYLMQFTANQLRAINHKEGNLQLIACAGSGKTEVVARRVANLLKNGLAPRNIIAFTFTDKAAAELKERILTRCREELGDLPGMAEMYVGTIHAFCFDLLKTEVPKYLKYDVLNEVQQSLFIDRNSKKSGLTISTDLNCRRLERYKDTPHYLTAISVLREAETDQKALEGCSVVNGLEVYRTLLDEMRYFDYSSIMDSAVYELTNSPEIRQRLGERIKHVIVDEYQDVNPIQEAMIWLLHEGGAKVCVVGDDDQTIYQWRGSNVQGILTFQTRYPNVDQISIEENFRSSEGIVQTARAFIEQNTERLPKQMQPTDAQAFEPGDIVALGFGDPDKEATHIAQTIQALRGVAIKDPTKDDPNQMRGIAWSDMAILLRSVSANAEPITSALDAAEIPYLVVGMNNLFGTPEAEAARQLFYFMTGRHGMDSTQLENVWVQTNLGLRRKELRQAIATAAQSRASFDNPTERFGFYSIQRTFQTFLEEAGVREERVPNERGDIVFYNLGKFSQLISDFETIHYQSKPKEKYESFANFLQYHAESAYPEGWQDNQYANPDAVRIMTIHQAKGMQWPVVFVPALLKNRFPSKKQGGRNAWHLVPRAAVKDQARYEGTIEDERRLFYVAMTRSQKFLHLTWAPVPSNQLFQRPSQFWDDILASKWVKRRPPDYHRRKRLPPTPRAGVANVVFSFSDIKYFFECPYQFKLRVLYGFNAPIHEALGYGRSLHNALAEVHARALRKDYAKESEAGELVATHLHTPYAYPSMKQDLEASAAKVIKHYIQDNRALFDKIEFSEKQIDISLGDGISVVGRIDLVRRIDTGETTIVDLKSSDRAQPEEVTETQLHVYALGYEELTGRRADYVEIYELDERKKKPRSVDEDFMNDVKAKVRQAAEGLRLDVMPPTATLEKCRKCDYRGMCTEGKKVIGSVAKK
jgi:DNA helicase-2/ATP-dependent DNA helicase PcrA